MMWWRPRVKSLLWSGSEGFWTKTGQQKCTGSVFQDHTRDEHGILLPVLEGDCCWREGELITSEEEHTAPTGVGLPGSWWSSNFRTFYWNSLVQSSIYNFLFIILNCFSYSRSTNYTSLLPLPPSILDYPPVIHAALSLMLSYVKIGMTTNC